MALVTSILPGGSNNHETSAEEANAFVTDFISQGIVGSYTNTSGVSPATGGLAVNAQGTPDMTVAVTAGKVYVTGTPTGGNSQTFRVNLTTATNVTITSNSSGSTKYDHLYVKLDPDKLANPNTAGDDAASLVTSRSSSSSSDDGTPPTYGYKLAVITVANGASSITNGNITDKRATTGTVPPSDGVTADKIDWASTGANAGIWWEELGRTTLSVAGDTITVSSIPARKYLRIMVDVINTGGTIDPFMRFNNDSGSNYVRRSSTNGAADVTTASGSTIMTFGVAAYPNYIVMDVINIATQEKMATYQAIAQNTAGAASIPGRTIGVGKWANTADQITRIDVLNTTGTGDFAIGSEVVVLGHN